ncbi:MAG: guanylate kinase [Magnetococcales bacterium]|nr:guanylate kinase [Magnetococcales bacterium]
MASRRGFVIILSAPSGAGKTTLMRGLAERLEGITISVSTTTRDCRPGEQEGVDYFFVSRTVFEAQIAAQAFLEHAEVFGNYYGTSRRIVESTLAAGQDVVLDIDWQGARQVRKHLDRRDVVGISILPPSQSELRQRLLKRGRDRAAVIDQRMELASRELSHFLEYDYLVVNDHLQQAQENLTAIVRAERCRRERAGSDVAYILKSFGISE